MIPRQSVGPSPFPVVDRRLQASVSFFRDGRAVQTKPRQSADQNDLSNAIFSLLSNQMVPQ